MSQFLKCFIFYKLWAFLVAQTVNNELLQFRRPGFNPWSGRFPGEGNATHSSILAQRILWTEEPVRPQSMGSQRVGYNSD